MRSCFSGGKKFRVRMLCSRSASFTSTTRTSVTMASSILRTLSTCRTSGETRSSRLILVTPSTKRAVSDPNPAAISESGIRASSTTSCRRAAQRVVDVQPQVCQDMSHFQGMGEVRFARLAQLRLMLVGGESEGPLEGSKVVPGTILPHVRQELGKARL